MGEGLPGMHWTHQDPDYLPPEIDTSRPSIARVYDAFLGGKDNFAVDRAVALEGMKHFPDGGAGARNNRAMLFRGVRFMTEQGIDQFLDVGSGLPTMDNTHSVAQRINPDARVVYVDNDPIVLAHARALLATDDNTRVITADLREPEAVFGRPEVEGFLDLSRPIGLLLVAVVHHLGDDEHPEELVDAYKKRLAPGSFLQLTHFCSCAPEVRALEKVLRTMLGTGRARDLAEIERFFDGLELVEPGVVHVPEWRPDRPVRHPLDLGGVCVAGGVARKP
ncbi:SAM-dependent methyltransferase [Actinomadura sp. ATCC 31491]|uniref:SAM-dependent methyltransferase n=1 Tax=Actinomadura luzonensis TaxID=2805427 RepID=A0ABT0G2I0_9ACTN|nr:SAM-dependent methyltransferase [Actinomadura luzonensis]MCK2218807.1 SAM-dependent methyltransferase [Actinomadura luzonensis]